MVVVVSLLSDAVDRRPLDGAALAFLLLANISNLDLLLQARGYGLSAFAALADAPERGSTSEGPL